MTASRMPACPRCGKGAPYDAANPHRPFCSERCKMVDLGAWANEDYRAAVRNEYDRDRDEGPPET